MPKNRFPVTPAIRVLKDSGISYTLHSYKYEEKGGTKSAADELNVDEHQVIKTIRPCEPEIAHRHTGYFVGGISPLVARKQMKMYYETSIVDIPYVYINAGRKGLLARISPKDLIKMIEAIPVNVAI